MAVTNPCLHLLVGLVLLALMILIMHEYSKARTILEICSKRYDTNERLLSNNICALATLRAQYSEKVKCEAAEHENLVSPLVCAFNMWASDLIAVRALRWFFYEILSSNTYTLVIIPASILLSYWVSRHYRSNEAMEHERQRTVRANERNLKNVLEEFTRHLPTRDELGHSGPARRLEYRQEPKDHDDDDDDKA